MAPEINTICAIDEFGEARDILIEMHRLGMDHATYVEAWFLGMGAIKVQNKAGEILTIRWDNAIPALQSEKLRQAFPSRLEISHKAKQDVIGKVLTVGQILWFLAQVISRHVQGYDVSLLEVSTISYIVFIVACSLIWLRKPFCVTEQLLITADDAEISATREDDDLGGRRFSNKITYPLSCTLIAAVFSGIHCLAWNYGFPSMTEAWLWRVAALVCFGAAAPAMVISQLIDPGGGLVAILWMGLLFYSVARVVLVVLAFESFRWAPSSIYASVNWAYYISFIN